MIDMRMYGKIIKIHESPNSFIIKTEDGSSTIRRNKWHLPPAPFKTNVVGKNNDLLLLPIHVPQNYVVNTLNEIL